MTMKKIALALLATSAMAQDYNPEMPWGSQSNFAFEVTAGSSTMEGSPYSLTATPTPSDQVWKGVNTSITAKTNTTAIGNLDIEFDNPSGYRANWNKMAPSARRTGFMGQLNVHYMAVQGLVGAGVYAGVGYNGAHSSSQILNTFDNTVYKNNLSATLELKSAAAGDSVSVYSDGAIGNYQYDGAKSLYSEKKGGGATETQAVRPDAGDALPHRAAKNANMPIAKATVSSGLMFQVGGRLGAMIGNVFPHVRVGWAAYQLKAHMTEQRKPYSLQADVGAIADNVVTVSNIEEFVEFVFDSSSNANTTLTLGSTQRFGNIDPLYETPAGKKVSSKGCQWANALTLGAGIDWSFNKMSVGLYYQAAICQRVTFKKWKEEMTAGLTSREVKVKAAEVKANVNPLAVGTSTMTYGATTPHVSIKPIFHTAALSVKYILGKA